MKKRKSENARTSNANEGHRNCEEAELERRLDEEDGKRKRRIEGDSKRVVLTKENVGGKTKRVSKISEYTMKRTRNKRKERRRL